MKPPLTPPMDIGGGWFWGTKALGRGNMGKEEAVFVRWGQVLINPPDGFDDFINIGILRLPA